MKVITKTGRKVKGKIAEIIVKHGNYAEILPEPVKEDDPIVETDPVITDDLIQVEPENEGIEFDKEPVSDSESEVREAVEEKPIQKPKRVYKKKKNK